MVTFTPSQLAAWRSSLARANPSLAPAEIERALEAIRREHEDPEQHDRTLIQNALARSPLERLRAMVALQNFIERARRARPIGRLRE